MHGESFAAKFSDFLNDNNDLSQKQQIHICDHEADLCFVKCNSGLMHR